MVNEPLTHLRVAPSGVGSILSSGVNLSVTSMWVGETYPGIVVIVAHVGNELVSRLLCVRLDDAMRN